MRNSCDNWQTFQIPNISVDICRIASWNFRRPRPIQHVSLLVHLSGRLVLELILCRYDYFVGEWISSWAFGCWSGRTGTFPASNTGGTLIGGRLWRWLEWLNCNWFWWFRLNGCCLLDWWKSLAKQISNYNYDSFELSGIWILTWLKSL